MHKKGAPGDRRAFDQDTKQLLAAAHAHVHGRRSGGRLGSAGSDGETDGRDGESKEDGFHVFQDAVGFNDDDVSNTGPQMPPGASDGYSL